MPGQESSPRVINPGDGYVSAQRADRRCHGLQRGQRENTPVAGDAGTLDALTAARARARLDAAPGSSGRPAWWRGAGTALAAGIAALVVLPQQPANSPERLFTEPDVVLVSDADADVADNLAFVCWLEDKADDSI